MTSNQKVVRELVERRSKSAKHYLLADGTFQAVFYSAPIHYTDEQGNMQNIETRLFDGADFDLVDFPVTKDKKEEFLQKREEVRLLKATSSLDLSDWNFHGLKVPFEATLPRNWRHGYTMGKGADRLTFKPIDAFPAAGQRHPVHTNCIEYQDAWRDVDVHLELTAQGIKETLTLKTPNASTSFSFEVIGPLADDLTAGVLKLEPAWLEDANGQRRDVTQTLRREDGRTFIDILGEVNGLTFPVKIDPTVTIQSYDIADAWIYEGQPSANFLGTTMNVGDGGNPSYVSSAKYAALINFDLSSIPQSAVVSSAILTLVQATQNYCVEQGYSLGAYPISSSWVENTVTWETRPSWDTNVEATCTITPMNGSTGMVYLNNGIRVNRNWSVTNHVQDWVRGVRRNDGFIVLPSAIASAGVGSGAVISSENTAEPQNRPKLSVNYNQPPTVPVITAPNGGETWNSQHTITWTVSSDNETIQSNLQYNIELTTDNGLTWKTLIGLTAPGATSYTYDFINELQSSSCLIRIRAYDGDLYGPWDQSNNVFTINHNRAPYAPTVTSPNGGETWDSQHTITWIAASDPDGQEIQYNVEISTDNGATWKPIVGLTGPGATSYSYDFINETQSDTCLIRVRAFDGFLYGPWDQSNDLFTINHNKAPLAPTNLWPADGLAIDRGKVTRLTWQHNDPNTGDPQSRYDLRWRPKGNAEWHNVSLVTPSMYWDVPINTLPHGVIEWQVRTYDQSGLVGPYSTQKSFFAGDKPESPTFTFPIDGATIGEARPYVTWSSFGQTAYHFQVYNASGVAVFDTGEVNSTNKFVRMGVDLRNNQTYTFTVSIKNSDGIWSDWHSITVDISYTPPAKPSVSTVSDNCKVVVSIDSPDPRGTQPSVNSYDLFRRKVGEEEFIRIATYPTMNDPIFSRSSVAYKSDGEKVGVGQPRFENGPFVGSKALMIEEGTTNHICNSDFETVTETGVVFSDSLTNEAAWTVASGSVTYGPSGANLAVNNTLLMAGNTAWRPLSGSGGQNLAVTMQSTFTLPAAVPASIAMKMYQDTENEYQLIWQSGDQNLVLYRKLGGTSTALKWSEGGVVAQVAGASYTMTLAIDTAGVLTAQLFSGNSATGIPIQTLTVTDKSLSGGFLLGVGGDANVIISSAIVTAARPDVWIIDASACSYSAVLTTDGGNAFCLQKISGSGGRVALQSRTVPAITTGVEATWSLWVKSDVPDTALSVSLGERHGANLFATMSCVAGTNWTRFSGTGVCPDDGAGVCLFIELPPSVNVYFDKAQVEIGKSYATTHHRNDSTTEPAGREAEMLTIPTTGVLLAKEGTIEYWFYEDGDQRTAHIIDTDGARPLLVYKENQAYKLRIGSLTEGQSWTTQSSVLAVGWHNMAISWQGAAVTWAIDDTIYSGTMPRDGLDLSHTTNLFIGTDNRRAAPLNHLMADIRISSITRSDSEVTAAFEIHEPLPVDGHTVCKVSLNGSTKTVRRFDDYHAASGELYEYKVRVYGTNSTVTETDPVPATVLALTGLWMHDTSDPSGTLLHLPRNLEQSEEWNPDVSLMRFAGRPRPVAEFGEMAESRLKVKLLLFKEQDWWRFLKELVQRRSVLCVRDSRGRKIFGVIAALPVQDTVYGQTVDLEVLEVDYSEVV